MTLQRSNLLRKAASSWAALPGRQQCGQGRIQARDAAIRRQRAGQILRLLADRLCRNQAEQQKIAVLVRHQAQRERNMLAIAAAPEALQQFSLHRQREIMQPSDQKKAFHTIFSTRRGRMKTVFGRL